MQQADFHSTKRVFKRAMTEVLAEGGSHALSEAALPAYSHRNPLVDLIFWQRLKISADQLRSPEKLKVVDFGCGSGVMSQLLAQMGHEVIAVDLDFAPLEKVRRHVDFPANISFHNKDLAELDLPASSVDAIVALDVLEHIHDFESYLALFLRILKPGGRIIVSGPTENWLYKLGRKLAGKQFSGDYHHTNIAAIRAAFARKLDVTMHARLIWPFTLFEIFSVRKPN
jgi:2-polyprenyl-3-methyl-5-hydroxy-6-metoxy-1,4-benzoquinol methylase